MDNKQLLKLYLQRFLVNDYKVINSIDYPTCNTFNVYLLGGSFPETYTFDCIDDILSISTIKGKLIASANINSNLFNGLPPFKIT